MSIGGLDSLMATRDAISMSDRDMENVMLRTMYRAARRRLKPIRQAARYGVGAMTGKLTVLPIDQLTDEFGFSFGPDGWNFYSALLAERLPFEETAFYRFFTHEALRRAQTLNEVLFLHDPVRAARGFQFYLGTYPWGGITRSEQGGEPFGWYYDQQQGADTRALWGHGRNLWYEPGERYTLEVERDLTLDLHAGIEQHGYHPWRHLSFPTVVLLVHRDGRTRGLIGNGHHRLAVLSHLGHQRVRVEITQVVRADEVERWFYVRDGLCTASDALAIFEAFFDLDGSERARHLGLLEQAKAA